MVQTQVRKIFLALGTVNTLTVFSDGCEDALDRARDRVTELHKKLSAFDSESEIGRINKNAGKAAVKVSSDTLRLIESAVSYSKQTNGLFDITINPLSMLWKNAVRRHSLPENGEVEAKLSLTNYRDILIDRESGTVMLKKEGQALDLGAIAKGFAADEVKRIFLEENINEAKKRAPHLLLSICRTRRSFPRGSTSRDLKRTAGFITT